MADRPSALNTGQWGLESSIGTLAAASKRLLATGFMMDVNVPTIPYTPVGFLVPTTSVQQKEETNITVSGAACYHDLPYLLSSLLLTGAGPTTPSGAVNTRRWSFKPTATAIDVFKSYTLEKGTAVQAERVVGAVMQALTMRWTKTEANLSGTMKGQVTTENVTITPTPTDITPLPIDPKSVDIYVGTSTTQNNTQTITITGTPAGGSFFLSFDNLTTAGILFSASAATVQTELEKLITIGKNVTVAGGPGPGTPYTVTFTGLLAGINASLITATHTFTGGSSPAIAVTNTIAGGMTKLTRVDSFELVIPDTKDFAYTLDSAVQSWSYPVTKAYEPRANLVLEHDSVGAGLMADLRARTTKYCKVLCRGPAVETATLVPFPSALQITFPFKFIENTRADVNGVYMSTYPMALHYDTTFAGFLQFDVDTYLTGL